MLPCYNKDLHSELLKPPVLIYHGELIDINQEFSDHRDMLNHEEHWTGYHDVEESSDEEADWSEWPELPLEEILLRKSIRKNDDPEQYEELMDDLDYYLEHLWENQIDYSDDPE